MIKKERKIMNKRDTVRREGTSQRQKMKDEVEKESGTEDPGKAKQVANK